MALGNRPKGSKWGYTTAFITFAISESLPSRSTSKIGTDLFELITLVTVYMTFAAFWIAFQSIKTMTASGGFTASALLNNRLSLAPIVVSKPLRLTKPSLTHSGLHSDRSLNRGHLRYLHPGVPDPLRPLPHGDVPCSGMLLILPFTRRTGTDSRLRAWPSASTSSSRRPTSRS